MTITAIHVEFIYPPIPDRSHDWCATPKDYEPGMPIGYGPTAQAAVADLLQHPDIDE